MSVHILTIKNTGSGQRRCPGIYFFTSRLYDKGFTPGALVQAVPAGEGVDFRLCDNNIKSYSALDAATREKGGSLVQTRDGYAEGNHSPALSVHGQLFFDGGLSIGDKVTVLYEQGLIRIRKLSETSKVIRMRRAKCKHTENHIPKLRLIGEWLADFGFTPGSLLTAAAESGSITLALQKGGIEEYGGMVRFARKSGLNLLQVGAYAKRGKLYPFIQTQGSCVKKAGFGIGDLLLATCGKGSIKLQKLDFSDLGF